MINAVQKSLLLLVPLALLSAHACAQDIPAVMTPAPYQGFTLPNIGGGLSFALSASESVRTGFYGPGTKVWSSTISGDVAYLSQSTIHPFSMVYSGGYSYSTGGQQSSIFQNLQASQVFAIGRWSFVASDAVSYLPESPSAGLSGVPGVGDVGVTLPDGNGQGILSRYGARVSNSATGSARRELTGATSFNASGSYEIQTFLDNSTGGVNNSDEMGSAGLAHRLDARNSLNASYNYSRFVYPGNTFVFTSQGINVGYTHQWTRQLSTDVSAGPQWISGSGSETAGGGGATINVAISADASYAGKNTNYTASFSRGARSGSGVVQGTITDTLTVGLDRRLGEFYHLGASGGYTRNGAVAVLNTTPFDVQTIIANAQISRALGESFSAFASYNAEHQINQATNSNFNGFTGLSQVFSVGISYSPRMIHLGHQ